MEELLRKEEGYVTMEKHVKFKINSVRTFLETLAGDSTMAYGYSSHVFRLVQSKLSKFRNDRIKRAP